MSWWILFIQNRSKESNWRDHLKRFFESALYWRRGLFSHVAFNLNLIVGSERLKIRIILVEAHCTTPAELIFELQEMRLWGLSSLD